MEEWIVAVFFGCSAPIIERFKDEQRARSFYADCLVKYPTRNVEFIANRPSK